MRALCNLLPGFLGQVRPLEPGLNRRLISEAHGHPADWLGVVANATDPRDDLPLRPPKMGEP